jgi:hypothetical protein
MSPMNVHHGSDAAQAQEELTVPVVAGMLRISAERARRLILTGKLPARSVAGRYVVMRSDLDAYIAKRTTEVRAELSGLTAAAR